MAYDTNLPKAMIDSRKHDPSNAITLYESFFSGMHCNVSFNPNLDLMQRSQQQELVFKTYLFESMNVLAACSIRKLHVPHTHACCPWKSEDGLGTSGNGDIDGCEPQCRSRN